MSLFAAGFSVLHCDCTLHLLFCVPLDEHVRLTLIHLSCPYHVDAMVTYRKNLKRLVFIAQPENKFRGCVDKCTGNEKSTCVINLLRIA